MLEPHNLIIYLFIKGYFYLLDLTARPNALKDATIPNYNVVQTYYQQCDTGTVLAQSRYGHLHEDSTRASL